MHAHCAGHTYIRRDVFRLVRFDSAERLVGVVSVGFSSSKVASRVLPVGSTTAVPPRSPPRPPPRATSCASRPFGSPPSRRPGCSPPRRGCRGRPGRRRAATGRRHREHGRGCGSRDHSQTAGGIHAGRRVPREACRDDGRRGVETIRNRGAEGVSERGTSQPWRW